MSTGVTPEIFISYRREEANYLAGWLHDRLADHFGPSRVFLDIDWIKPGVGFMEVIGQALAGSRVVLAIIGRRWLNADRDGHRRLDRPDDPVRVEIETALRRNIQVIPLLLDDAAMPRAEDLPQSIAELARLNALRVSYDSFRDDVDRLVGAIDVDPGHVVAPAVSPTEPAAGAPPPQRRSRAAPEFTASELRRADDQRSRLLRRVSRSYSDHLQQSLEGAGTVELGLDFDGLPEATVRTRDQLFLTPAEGRSGRLPDGTTMLQIFDRTGGLDGDGLLVLGGAGAGKTTLLFQLGAQLAERALADLRHPVPIYLSLSSWANRRQPLGDWLVGQLAELYQVPEALGRRWVVDGELLLLLDGLDEIPDRRHRVACVQAINQFSRFGRVARVPSVVAGRPAEYEALPVKLHLETAVGVRPVDASAVLRRLEQAGSGLSATAAVVRRDPELLDLLRTPLLISMLTLAYAGADAAQVGATSGAPAERRHRLIADYVDRRFELERRTQASLRSPARGFAPERTRAWLSALALNLARGQQAVYLVGRTPVDWLPTRWARALVLAAPGPLVGAAALFIMALAAALRADSAVEGSGSLVPFIVVLSVATGAALGLMIDTDARPTRRSWWSWGRARSHSRRSLLFGLVYGALLGGLVFLGSGESIRVLFAMLVGLPIGALMAVVVSGFTGLRPGLGVGITVGITYGALFCPGLLLILMGDFAPVPDDVYLPSIGELVDLALAEAATWGLAAGVSAGLVGPPRPAENLTWSWSRARSRLWTALVIGLIVELVTAWTFWGEEGGGRSFGVIVGLLGGLGALLIIGLEAGRIPLHVTPNEPIRLSIRNGAALAVAVAVAVGLPVGLGEGLRNGVDIGISNGLAVGAVIGLLCGTAFGLGAAAQHGLLRLLLAMYGIAPLRYVRWLDHAVRLRFLYRDASGGYVFIHGLVQEHFTDLHQSRSDAEVRP